jgi:hypothetical protein
VVLRIGFAFFLCWLYLGDLSRLVKVKLAPLALLNTLPSLPTTLLGSVAALAVTGTLLLDLGQRLPDDWRPRGLIHFAACALLFFDFTVLSARLSTEFPEARIAGVIQALAETASNASTPQQVPTDRRGFEDWARQNAGPVPLFKEGVPVEQWHVTSRNAGVLRVERSPARVDHGGRGAPWAALRQGGDHLDRRGLRGRRRRRRRARTRRAAGVARPSVTFLCGTCLHPD